VAETAWSVDQPTAVAARPGTPRHAALVRVTHWLTTLCFLALLVSGLEIVVSHPRFYWGETGNVLTPALFSIPIPSSRATVPTGYGYVLPDQNGWSRYLHFEAAWVLVLTGALYVIWGALSGHFRKDLLPDAGDRSVQAFSRALVRHLRFARPVAADAWSYNLVQRLSYLLVIFVLFPLVIWTGLAMSPAFVSAVPSTVTILGGRQSARTLHFLVTVSLVAFLLVHVAMVWFARLPVDASYLVDVAPSLFLIGIGAGLAFPSIVGLAMSGAHASDAGLASGLVNTTRMVGGSLGLALMASIATSRGAELSVAGADGATALTGGSQLALAFAAVLIVGAIGVAWTVLREPRADARADRETERDGDLVADAA